MLLILACLLTTPVMAQQDPDNGKTVRKLTETGDDAPELTIEASLAIDKGLKYLLTIQKPDGSWD
ncbi:MAG: hypothetical protein HQ567_10375, partial [Candidatus Nealsonbacteria bacterium]|nr:hypothetical protein [Candidatus Nealsonbacteria bacterium]